jgi:hypothetical protein
MEQEQKQIIISEGTRPFWQVCIAAAAYLIAIVLFIVIAAELYTNPTEKAFGDAVELSGTMIFLFVVGTRYSVIQNIYFDLNNKKYKKEVAIGPIRFGKWIKLPQIEYISIFRQKWSHDDDGDGITDSSGHNYDVNVWHHTSKHFTIYSHEEPGPAFEMGRYLAAKLQVDLLDATVPNDFKWIELEKADEEQTA